jgi:hypothetical protein
LSYAFMPSFLLEMFFEFCIYAWADLDFNPFNSASHAVGTTDVCRDAQLLCWLR